MTKEYQPGRPVLVGLDLEVRPGELLVLVGPSGCGKSTVLRLLAGLEEPGAGDVLIGGRSVLRDPPGRRDVAMVFQNYALYPHMSVRENLAFGLKARRTPAQEIARRIQSAASALGLEPLLERLPRQLSGGQRQRVALGRALVREPRVFLLDEPLSNLDAQLRVRMRAEIKELHARVGATMLHVTHDQTEAMSLGHRVAVLRDGLLQQLAPPEEVYRRPANLFVASFLGSPRINTVDVEFRDEGRAFALGQPLPAGAPRLPAGTQRVLGLRAEALRLAAVGWPAQVNWVENLGADRWVHVRGDGFDWVVRSSQEAPKLDARVHVAWAWDEAHWFDPVSGERLDLPGEPA